MNNFFNKSIISSLDVGMDNVRVEETNNYNDYTPYMFYIGNTKSSMNYKGSTLLPTTTGAYIDGVEEESAYYSNTISNSNSKAKLKRFEAKYDMESKKFFESYKRRNFDVIRQIDLEDTEDWKSLYIYHYGL